MNELIDISNRNIETAHRIIADLRIYEIFAAHNSVCNLIGSVKNGLLMNRLDIDFHCYSEEFTIARSFQIIAAICENPKIKEVSYKNLLDAEDGCLEWHLTYEETPQRLWTIDVIHIKNDSLYVGKMERVAEKIAAVLTEQHRETILKLKYECEQRDEKIMGITIYQAVIDDNVTNYDEFQVWQKERGDIGISLWEPQVSHS